LIEFELIAMEAYVIILIFKVLLNIKEHNKVDIEASYTSNIDSNGIMFAIKRKCILHNYC
jgi:hypothetical protein